MDAASDHLASLGVLALGSRLRRLADQLMTDANRIYRSTGAGFKPRWYPLFTLVLAREPITIGDAASTLGNSHVAVSRMAKEMATAGLLVAVQDREDRRTTTIRSTPHGHDVAADLKPVWSLLRSTCADIVDRTGHDLLATLSALDASLAHAGLRQTFTRANTERRVSRVDIVTFQPAYAEDFRRLNLDWLERYFTVGARERLALADLHRHILDPGGEILFAKLGPKIVGTGALRPHQPGIYEVTKMAVSPQYQGWGIGRKILKAILDLAKTKAATTVFLQTNARLQAALHLYRSMGFREVADFTPIYEIATHHLEIRLSPTPD